jgi:hypothetical protein
MDINLAAGIVYAGIPGFAPQQYSEDYQIGPLEQKYGVGFNLNSAIKQIEALDRDDICSLCGENLPERHAHAAITRDGEYLAICGHCKEVFGL